MTDEKKTGETSETPYPGTLSWAATRLLEAICDAAKAVAEMLWESILCVFRGSSRRRSTRSGSAAAVAHSPARAATTCT